MIFYELCDIKSTEDQRQSVNVRLKETNTLINIDSDINPLLTVLSQKTDPVMFTLPQAERPSTRTE